MICEQDKIAIQKISKKYNVKRVLLFGSNLDPTREARDIDLAVEGVKSQDFFRYYGELMFALSKPVDVVDLSGTSKFINIVREEGITIYG